MSKILTKDGKILLDEEGKIITLTNNNTTNEPSLLEITYDELKTLRDMSQLTPGQQYRITDYVTTTMQENTKSAGHRFDIIVTADSENTLNENARACYNKNDNYFSSKTTITTITKASFIEGTQPSDITVYYKLYVDWDEASYDINEGLKPGDYITEINYAKNNYGYDVPVFYKNSEDYEDEGTDYNDTFYYAGTHEIDGIVYDKWRKIEHQTGWKNEAKIFVLTNRVVENVSTEETTLTDKAANLSAWEIKYCLDNDTSRFEWADDTDIKAFECTDDGGASIYLYTLFRHKDLVNKVAWVKVNYPGHETPEYHLINWKKIDIDINDVLYTDTETVSENDVIYRDSYEFTVIGKPKPQGKGVIYYMKDEYNNECPYDFKNIMYYDEGENKYVYTFNWITEDVKCLDASVMANNGTVLSDEGTNLNVHDNIIKPLNYYKQSLNFIYFISNYSYDSGLCYGYRFNIFDTGCSYISFRDACSHNIFGINSSHIKFSIDCGYNTIGNDCTNIDLTHWCSANTIGNNCNSITFDEESWNNTIGNKCININIGYANMNNTIGNNCSNIDFDYESFKNYIGDNCDNIILGHSCECNTFGSNCTNIEFSYENNNNCLGIECDNIILEEQSYKNTFGDNCIGIKSDEGMIYNTIGNDCVNITIGPHWRNNTIGNNCGSITFDRNSERNTIGNNCSDIEMFTNFKDNTIGNNCSDIYFRYFSKSCIIENSVHDIIIEKSESYTNNSYDYTQNIIVKQGVHSTEISPTRGLDSVTIYKPYNSQEITVGGPTDE